MASGFSLCSFGRSLVWPVSSGVRPRPRLRRAVRAFLAARRRWPAGRLGVLGLNLVWRVDGCAALMWGWDRDGHGPFSYTWAERLRMRFFLPRDARAEIEMFGDGSEPVSGPRFWWGWARAAVSLLVRGPL